MRRYLRNFHLDQMKVMETDVLIVGAGIAGLWTALHIPSDARCLVVCKNGLENSNSWLAQGGVAAVFDENDTFESHIQDTLNAGAGLCNNKVVEILVKEAPENIEELINLGVSFDEDEDGNLHMGREGGHSCRRILHSGGDATGRAITHALFERVFLQSNINLLPNTNLTEIFTNTNGVAGAMLVSDTHTFVVKTSRVVIATGGIGQVYEHTTNPKGAIGDGIVTAMRAGAEVERMEMVQFHPTTLVAQNSNTERTFLISEAVRGEGAILRNLVGESFMETVHPMKDLAPRDIVTRGILKELQKTGDPHANLDVSSMTKRFFSQRFPTIYAKCEVSGIRLPYEEIPIHPAQHYFMGGLKTDENGQTNVSGLWAVGECACNGVHGANRLASNSMLECLVFGKRCAESISKSKRELSSLSGLHHQNPEVELDDQELNEMRLSLRRLMEKQLGPIRTTAGIELAINTIDEMIAKIENTSLAKSIAADLYAMLIIAKSISEGARARKASIGAHYLENEVC